MERLLDFTAHRTVQTSPSIHVFINGVGISSNALHASCKGPRNTKVSNFIWAKVCCLTFQRILQAVFERVESFWSRQNTLWTNFESRLFNWVLTSPRLELQLSFKVMKTLIFVLFCLGPYLGLLHQLSLKMAQNYHVHTGWFNRIWNPGSRLKLLDLELERFG